MSDSLAGGAGAGAGQKLSNPLPPIQRPLLPPGQDQPDQPANIVSQPKVLRPAVFSKVSTEQTNMQRQSSVLTVVSSTSTNTELLLITKVGRIFTINATS